MLSKSVTSLLPLVATEPFLRAASVHTSAALLDFGKKGELYVAIFS